MPIKRYNEFLEINPSFESVVDIDSDKRNRNLWREYIVGEDMETLMEALCASLGNEAPDQRRSFWIHGSYGTGKSYAAIFVKHLIEEPAAVVDEFLAASGRLSKFRNRFAKCRKNGDYLVIWKTGCTGIRSGDMMLLEAEKAIQDALVEKFGDSAYLGSSSLMAAVKAKLEDPSINWEYLRTTTTLGDDYASVDALREKVNVGELKALQRTAAVIRQKGYGMVNNLETFKAWIADIIEGNQLSKSGIFFIWDEFTEYVAHSDDHTVMQQISEFCKEKPFFMLYVVHRSQEMVDSMGKERYQLITNRFHQVEFHVSPDAAYDLIAGSINTRPHMEDHWKDAREPVIKQIKKYMPDMTGLDDRVNEMLDLLCPMHPMTVRLLSRVAESFAAATRTMFRFMKDQSDATLGFVGYIHTYGPDDQACWLTPEWLWDYFFTRESDFSDKDTKAAEYILHYEESRHLVEKDENALRVFKIAMLLLAVMSSTRGIYGGSRANGGIAATEECLVNCLAGVMSKEQVRDLLATMEDSKILLRDRAANGVVRLQLPFRSSSGDDFNARMEINEKKYSRYQMFAKDAVFSSAFEKQAWDENDATFKRMKICACCAETLSIQNRLEEIKKDLEKNPYKLGLLIVTVKDDAQYLSIQSDLAYRISDAAQPRLTIALVKTPLSDDKRKSWLTSITRQEMASAGGQTASAAQHQMEAEVIVRTWVSEAVSGGKLIAWNEDQVFNNQFGMANLRKTIKTNVLEQLFPYAPETVVVTNTAYKPCNDAAPLAGITRDSGNSQLKSVLNVLQVENLLGMSTIEEMTEASGSKAASSIAELAKMVRSEMLSGQRVILSDLWEKLQKQPFGYYNCIACGVLLGFVFSCYKDGPFSWTDNVQSTHVLGEATMKTMVLNMCKGTMTTDYLSAGSVTFQRFREYIKKILHLSDAQTANETECWRSTREAITMTGAPFWALKYLPEDTYGSLELRNAALEIVDNVQQFIAQESDRETIMGNVVQLFAGRGKVRVALEKAFQDKTVMSKAFRAFLFGASPELREIAEKLTIPPEELSDKLHMVMQDAIYTWTEAQVKEKLADVVSEYRYLDCLNSLLEKVYHNAEAAQTDLSNLFKYVRIPLAAVEQQHKEWYSALRVLYRVSRNGIYRLSQEERIADVTELKKNGKAVIDFLKDGKPFLADILEARGLECTADELSTVYTGLKDMTAETTYTQFERELKSQIWIISRARNRILLQERWVSLTGKERVKDWCTDHGTPIMWIVDRELRSALTAVIDTQNGKTVLDEDVQKAIQTLNPANSAVFTDDKLIAEAFVKTVGTEYREILTSERASIMTQAKLKLGNDMSAWDLTELSIFQRILKNYLQEKAKKEKLAATKSVVQTMKDTDLRSRVTAFLDAHPEFCDSFTE